MFITDDGTSRRVRGLGADERAIEGLPIRLVIAVAVGVAALGLMMGTLEEFDGFERTEVSVRASEELLAVGDGPTSVTLRVVTAEGKSLEDSRILVTGGSAPLAAGPVPLETDADGERRVTVGAGPGADIQVAFRTGQRRGTIDLAPVPPPGDEFVDERGNPQLVVVDG